SVVSDSWVAPGAALLLAAVARRFACGVARRFACGESGRFAGGAARRFARLAAQLFAGGAAVLLAAAALRLAACRGAPTGQLRSSVDGPSGDGAGGDAATISTDRPDYQPGHTVTFTGRGWAPGETVTIVLRRDPPVHGDGTL